MVGAAASGGEEPESVSLPVATPASARCSGEVAEFEPLVSVEETIG